MISGRNLSLFALTIALLLALGPILGCAPGSEEEDKAQQNAEAWAWLVDTKAELDAKRAELQTLEEAIAQTPEEGEEEEEADAETEEADAEGEAGEEGAEVPPSPEEQAEQLRQEISELDQEFYGRLIDYINSLELVEGQELTEQQRQAFDWKAEEDILVAQEYIDKGGDYRKAIEIYTTALVADPESELLLEAKARAEELRYMSEERFGQVEKGMTQEEVRETLGIPKRMNIREFENGIIGWFYPKEEPRTAAGVFFQEKDGELEVYKTDFEAVKADDEEGTGMEEG